MIELTKPKSRKEVRRMRKRRRNGKNVKRQLMTTREANSNRKAAQAYDLHYITLYKVCYSYP